MAEYPAAHTAVLESRQKLRQLFFDFAQDLIRGYMLDTEGLVDVLTLKGNAATSSKDPVIALEKLYRDTVSRPVCSPT